MFCKENIITMTESSIVTSLFKINFNQYLNKHISITVKRTKSVAWMRKNMAKLFKNLTSSKSNIMMLVFTVFKMLLTIMFKSIFVKSWKKTISWLLISALPKICESYLLTWSVTLLLRGSPPSRSNCTSPNIRVLQGNCSNPHVIPLIILSKEGFSHISKDVVFIMCLAPTYFPKWKKFEESSSFYSFSSWNFLIDVKVWIALT